MLEIKKLNKKFKQGFAIQDISFNVKQGDVLAIVGKNGAGKTTIIKSIFGELKIDSGDILYNGENLFKNNNLSNIAFFPDSNNIPLNVTLNTYLEYVGLASGMTLKNVFELKEKAYQVIDMRKYEKVKLKELSAGLKKKAIMVSVLFRRPKMIIFDEPTANLDIVSKEEFLNTIKELVNIGITVVITSHILDELQELANRLIIVQQGKIVYDKNFDKTKEQIKDIFKWFEFETLNKKNAVESLYED